MKKNSAPSTAAERAAGVRRDGSSVETDRDRQEVKFRLSYTAVGIAAFAVLATVILAVLVGKEWANRRTVSTETTPELLAGPARPEVLNARPGQGNNASGAGESATDNSPAPTPTPPSNPTPTPNSPSGPSPLPPAAVLPGIVNGKASRVVGLNYLIVQSYPDEAAAKASIDLLAKSGIPATIERNLEGFPKWAIVVTAQGYPKGSTETEALRKKIDQLSADQARKDRKWKAWTPIPYRWRG